MIWTPNPTVTIDGVDYTGDTLEGVQVTMGRPDTTQQPQAGYATLTLLELGTSTPAFTLGASLVITVDDSTSSPRPIFTGTLSDVVTRVESPSIDGHVTTLTLTAVGPLARLNRRTAGASGYPAQADGDRVAAILEEVYSTSWAEQPGTQTWSGTNSSLTWGLYDPYLGTIDTPGLYDLSSYAADETNAYELAGIAALSGLGIIHETPDGRINYDDADHRQDNAILNGYLELPTSVILSNGLETSMRLGDITNSITLNYTGGSVTASDATSIALIGPVSETYTTVLANALDAADQAARYLDLNANPSASIDQVQLPVTAVDLPTSIIDDLIGLYCGTPIRITDLPGTLGSDFSGYVEGWTWTLTDNTADLQLAISDFAKSAIATKWQDTNPATLWNTLDASLDWQEALVIA